MSLKIKVVQGLMWVAGSNILVRLLSFLATLILAKILTPHEFGLFGIAEMVINMSQVFKDMGLTKALIYRTEQIQEAAQTIFLINVGWGFCITLIIMSLANNIALFFGEPNATIIIQCMAMTIFITSFGAVPMTLVEKNLAFNKKLLPETIPILFYTITAVTLAWFNQGIWSIIIGRIIQTVLAVILIWYVSQWQFKLYYNHQIAKETLKYGRHVVSAAILTMSFLYIDNAFVAKFLGVKALGFYAFAFTLANLPTQSITPIINQVAFPSYVKLRDNPIELKKAYLNSVELTTLLTFPISVGLAILADSFIQVIYGDKWASSIALVQVLSFYGLSRSIGALPGNIFYTLHQHHHIPRLMLIYLMIIALFLWPTSQIWGIWGVALTMTLVMIIGSIIWLLMANYYLNISLNILLKLLLPQALSSLIMAIALLYLKNVVAQSLAALIILTFIGAFIYITSVLLMTKGKAYKNIANIMLELRLKKLA